jgi:hypothetical protein
MKSSAVSEAWQLLFCCGWSWCLRRLQKLLRLAVLACSLA